MDNIIDVILAQLVTNQDYFNRVWAYLKEDYFHVGAPRNVYNLIKNHVDEYNETPSKTTLTIAADKANMPEPIYNKVREFINTISDKQESVDWLVSETEKYVKETAIHNATSRIIEIQDNANLPKEKQNSKIPSIGAIPDIMKDAVSISFDTSLGHDWLRDAEDRWRIYNEKLNKLPFKLNILNRITKHGVERKTLNLILAGANCFVGSEEIEVIMSDEELKDFLEWQQSKI